MQDDVGERLRGVVADQRLAALGDNRIVKRDRFLEVCVHGDVYAYIATAN